MTAAAGSLLGVDAPVPIGIKALDHLLAHRLTLALVELAVAVGVKALHALVTLARAPFAAPLKPALTA